MDTFTIVAGTVLSHLAWASIQAALLIGVVWLLGRALPRLPAATRCLLWWLVGAQLLIGLLWQAPVRLPLLSPAPAPAITVVAPSPDRVAGATVALPMTASHAWPATRARHAVAPVSTTAHFIPSWRQALLALWLSGLLVQLGVFARQWQRARRIRRASQPLDDPRLQALCARLAHELGLRRMPELRRSAAIDSPQVTGMWRPTVLLPAGHTWSANQQAMALAHELAHLRRGDLWLGWVPTLARWLFFFHPLVHVAMREYALHREAACDARALALQPASAQAYGRLLLQLGVDHPLHAGLAGASPSFHNLKRRLLMLQRTANSVPRLSDWLLVALVAVAFIAPYRVVAASQPAQASSTATPPQSRTTMLAAPGLPAIPAAPLPPAPPAPSARSTPPPALPAVPPVPSVPVRDVPPVPPVPAVPAVPPVPPVPPAPASFGFHAHSTSIDIDSHATFGFALFDHGDLFVHGNQADADAFKALHAADQPTLWFRRDGKAWITHDKAIITRARQTYAPLLDSARQQGRLAGQQGALAGRQAGLAAREAAFAQRQAALAQRRGALAQQQAELAAHASAEQSDTRNGALQARQQALDAQQARLKQQHATLEAKLDAKRKALQAQQATFEAQRQALARRQAQVAPDVTRAMTRLFDDAVASGAAKRVTHE